MSQLRAPELLLPAGTLDKMRAHRNNDVDGRGGVMEAAQVRGAVEAFRV